MLVAALSHRVGVVCYAASWWQEVTDTVRKDLKEAHRLVGPGWLSTPEASWGGENPAPLGKGTMLT